MEESTIINNIADNMQFYMAQKNINSSQIAKQIGCSLSTVKRVKLGYNSTTIFNLMNISIALGITLNQLVENKR